MDIITAIRAETDGRYFRDAEDKGEYIRVTCPNHKGGQETHPSCSIYSKSDSDSIEYGKCHCFTCGYVARLQEMVSDVFAIPLQDAEDWLTSEFAGIIVSPTKNLLPIEQTTNKVEYLDESILDAYNGYHDYMWKRKLSKDVVDYFRIGYNKDHNSITFPVWDEHSNLVMITERYIDTKRFHIPQGVDKPVYLLNCIKKFGYSTVIVCESQINALTCWSYGYPAIALFGTGSKTQYSILKKSGIRHYVLMFDGDEAGRKGANRFLSNMPSNVLITDIVMPNGTDVNDLSKNEFDSIIYTNIGSCY